MEIERRCLLALVATRFVVAPEAAPAIGSRTVVLCDKSAAIIQWLISVGYHQTPEEVLHAAMQAFMAHPNQSRPRPSFA
jgi:hypothetical protein